jgi:hypothetical protein
MKRRAKLRRDGAGGSRGVMDWTEVDAIAAHMPLAAGYRLGLLRRAEVASLIALIDRWFPDIRVGAASGYLHESFYARRVSFEGGPPREVAVAALRCSDELAGMFSFACDPATLAVHAQLSVAAPQHRGAGLAKAGMRLTEAVGRRLGMGLAYGMATLKSPHAQTAFEGSGWQLVGIAPGYDREMVAPGVVKRVYEAVYAKVLVDDDGLSRPSREGMTERTRALFGAIYDAAPAADSCSSP